MVCTGDVIIRARWTSYYTCCRCSVYWVKTGEQDELQALHQYPECAVFDSDSKISTYIMHQYNPNAMQEPSGVAYIDEALNVAYAVARIRSPPWSHRVVRTSSHTLQSLYVRFLLSHP